MQVKLSHVLLANICKEYEIVTLYHINHPAGTSCNPWQRLGFRGLVGGFGVGYQLLHCVHVVSPVERCVPVTHQRERVGDWLDCSELRPSLFSVARNGHQNTKSQL
jgi:hypothetical protein